VGEYIQIFTPSGYDSRGCQLSVTIKTGDGSSGGGGINELFKSIQDRGVVCDVRKPDVIRLAPTPMYNSYNDVYEFVMILKEELERINSSAGGGSGGVIKKLMCI